MAEQAVWQVGNKKLFAVMTIARQINGEYVFVRGEKAFTQASKADALLKQLKSQFATPEGKVKPVKISTPHGDAECFCEVGAFELEVEE
jgi:hypothetical protein